MAHFRIADVWVLGAARRVAVAGAVLDGEVRAGMIARGANGFEAPVRAVEFARQADGGEHVTLDLGTPESAPVQWLVALQALRTLEVSEDPASADRAT